MIDCGRVDCPWPECQCSDPDSPRKESASFYRALATIFAMAAIAAGFIALSMVYL